MKSGDSREKLPIWGTAGQRGEPMKIRSVGKYADVSIAFDLFLLFYGLDGFKNV